MNNATIQTSFNNGNIIANNNYLGGIVGYISNGSNVSNTYNRGEIKGSSYVGGIAGYIVGAYSNRANVNFAYNTGLISGTANVNGVIGASGSYTNLSRVYYDTSVLADFDPGQGYIKPAITNNSYGKTSDFLLNSNHNTLGFNENTWELRSKSGDYDYYPQLTVFANNSNLLIKTDSLESVKIDVSYGFGTKDSPFLIKTEQDMHDLSLNVAKGNTYLNYHFKVNDGLTSFDLGDFIPIGSADNEFQGSFDGNGAEFKLNIDRPDSDYQGLFGFHRTGEIKNLSVSGTVRGRSYVGGIVGYQINSKVLNVYNEATILGEGNYTGGITGYLTSSSTIDYAYNTGEITGSSYVGGIAGYITGSYSNNSYIKNAYSRGKVSSKTSGNVNGVAVAGSYGYINNSYYDVIVIANYYQPEGYFKPSSLESASYALNSQQFYDMDSTRLNANYWHFEERTSSYGHYPQLKYFVDHPYDELDYKKNSSRLSVRVNITKGVGTFELPFIIHNEDDLIELNNKVKNGNTFQGFYFKVDDSVERLEFENYEPIGTPNNPFYGSFDGNNKEFNINIESESDYQGLFGYFGIGKISNLYVTGSITGNDYVAGVVGRQISGNIENVYNLATVTGNSYVGGIVGHMNNATIQSSFNNGSIIANNNYLGGIVGYISNGSNVSNTYNRGEIKGSNYVGGITGYSVGAYSIRTYVNYSYNSGLVSGTANVNGVIGANGSHSYLSHVYYDTTVLADFDPGQGYIKPAITNNSYGKTSDFLLNSSLGTLGFNASIWELRSKSGDYDYYPQLTVFANNSNLLIKTDSLESVKIDVSYGFGTKDSPFLIKTEQDMHDLSLNVAKGNTYLNYHFKVNDGLTSFDLGDFIPIGSADNEFQGSFDGNGAEFKLNIDRPDSDYQGLFGFHRTGEIKNLSVSGTVRGRSYVGGIVGYQINSKVLNVYNEATILGEGNYTGGITGYLTSSSTIDYAYNTGEITGANYVGGIAGSVVGSYSYGSYIRNTYSRGEVSSKTSGNVNGVAVAGSYGYINNSYYDVIVIANYYQPEGYFKPSSLETATYAKNTSQLIYNNQGLLANSHFYFEPKTTESGYYPQLKVFSENEVTETASRSLESVTIDISGGVGTFDLPFMIYNEDDLIELNSKVKNGNTFQGFYFKVADSVERLEFENYEPIGTPDNPFYGSFDGNNKEFNINIETESDYQGLFGYFGIGKISNLYVTGSITGNDYVAGVVGRQISGNIENVYNLATVTGNSYVGGIVGHMNNATIQTSFNNGNITASANYLGGIVGYISNSSNVSNTYNRGEIKGGRYVGGIAGYSVGAYSSRTYINYAYSAGLVSGTANVNGVIGANGSHSYLSHVYYDTTVLADFDPGQGYIKPAITNNSYGKTSDFLLNSSLGTLGFNQSIWELRSKSGDYDYYPQLTVFANNSNLLIKTDSLESVKIDVSYGFGTKDSPFLIKTEQDMHDLSLNVAKGNTYLNYHFKVDDGLTSFDLGDFIPIGSADNEFQGSFDGNGAEFKLNIDRPDSDYQGLFGFHRTGEIKNLSVSGTVRGRSYVGGIVGYQINSKVLNVYNEATILGEGNYTGGITG